MSASPNNVLPEGIERKKMSASARRRARKARKVAQAGSGGEPQQNAETMHKAPEQAEAVQEEITEEEAQLRRGQEVQIARAELKKKEESRLKREQEAQAAHTEKMKKLNAKRAFLVHSCDNLRPYRRYTQIYGERKFQKPVNKPQNVGFLDMPLEIRLMIYGHALEFDEPIELWPETGDMDTEYYRRVRNRSRLRKMFGRRGPRNLGLLRTCKQVCAEATEVFYGNNEFRFSGLNGHMVAYAFATKIGSRNLGFMKSMTMAIPCRSGDRGCMASHWNPHTWLRTHEVYDLMPFSYPWTKGKLRKRFPRLDFEDSWRSLAWMLAGAYRLNKIKFVLPHYIRFRLEARGLQRHMRCCDRQLFSAMDDIVAAKPFLQVAIVRMFKDPNEDASCDSSQRCLIKELKSIVFCNVRLARFCKNQNWELDPQPYVDRDGGFVEDQALDASENPLDMLPDIERLFVRAAAE
ncbi:uncharacterized protein J4E84_005195 [Alternaria hordeiaustralica]|uniref:uncharacterized protein n=1 Tax=Alternaria hordeiaustralica TaxID=1187925 RepID=UPI0020C41C45|nr:uncharacterized protein J4E84_005195 [Alternaria hordeiaustralica]KAI4688264.1 hypothetical protein J4E84_005195 [Alternaria hordeiaustralica]